MVEIKYDDVNTFEFQLPFQWSIKYKQDLKRKVKNYPQSNVISTY